MQTADAAIGRIGAALDQPARFEAIDQTADRDRLDLADRGHFVLGDARLAAQPRQNYPLRARHAASPRPLVEARPLSFHVALAVGKQAQADGLADATSEDALIAAIRAKLWEPAYADYVRIRG